jgi:hypothetical protein
VCFHGFRAESIQITDNLRKIIAAMRHDQMGGQDAPVKWPAS